MQWKIGPKLAFSLSLAFYVSLLCGGKNALWKKGEPSSKLFLTAMD